MKSRLIVLACVLGLLTTGSPSCFAAEDPAAIAVDAVLVRPACLVSTIVGSALFVICLPVAAPSKSIHRAAKALVLKPAAMTFTRPLGQFQDLYAF